ncbi:MAG: PHP domain-containing protein [Firmicutes bacterium]|nr:PHP domain-containing protein [Bacillota bacterium]
MDTFKCNYHMHSHYSNGTLSPAQLVRKYIDEEYDVLSLTDHDSIDGIKEFLAACEATKIKGVVGVELTTTHDLMGKVYNIHILGYNFDPENEALAEACRRFRENTGSCLSAEEAIRIVGEAGGQTFLAHPVKIPELGERDTEEFYKEFEVLLKDLKKKGLKGLECINPMHTEDEEYRFIQYAGKYHLHISSGTDHHGEEI